MALLAAQLWGRVSFLTLVVIYPVCAYVWRLQADFALQPDGEFFLGLPMLELAITELPVLVLSLLWLQLRSRRS